MQPRFSCCITECMIECMDRSVQPPGLMKMKDERHERRQCDALLGPSVGRQFRIAAGENPNNGVVH